MASQVINAGVFFVSDFMNKPNEMTQTKWAEIKAIQSPNEAVLQIMAWLADTVKVREVGGNNHGPWVKKFLASTGLGEGNPWCAAAINYCAQCVDAPTPSSLKASVEGWQNWAEHSGRLREKPERGYLCVKQSQGISHIGIVVSLKGGVVESIEGNTSSGDHGSQQDGGGLYRRQRPKDFWDCYISLEPEK